MKMRTAAENELATTSSPRRAKKDESCASLSSRIQAWQESADSRQKHLQHVVNGNTSVALTSSTKIGSVRDARFSSYKKSKAASVEVSAKDADSHEMSGMVSELNEAAMDTRKQLLTALAVTEGTSKNLLGSSFRSSSTEFNEIQQSVQRLRAQRTHVERISQRNEELERQLAEQKAENETLRREVFTLRGADQENVTYLQSVKLLEQRARELEESCHEKKLDLRTTTKRLNYVEQERDELCEKIKTIRQDYEDEVKVLRDKKKKLMQLIEQLKQSHDAQTDENKRTEHHWKQKMKATARANSETIDSLQQQLEASCKQTSKLEAELHDLNKQVQKLLATTVRQTTIIEECDRMLSEAEVQHQQTHASYEEQLQCSSELNGKNERLELQLASLKQSKSMETIELEKRVLLLENQLVEHKDRLKIAEEALQNKDKEIGVVQRAYATRDDNRLHLDEVNKKLQRKERYLKSTISELQIALRDATDEKKLVEEQVVELQEKLESERKDRSHWATSRLKLLAEFCDEESKLSSALSHHSESQVKESEEQATYKEHCDSYSGFYSTRDDSEVDETRRSSIVFG
ncbi:hypothetical protein GN244_ATG17681 [Phytophthora infestans]|uniref:Uncharacterized protein n=1 Tax=Phytophthora infestans TaxID=4787 RepID=A0A833SMV8_PHYIN|nr:hypothetical protein GN244_ATG17681 [Phytophthora infestans]